MLKYEELSQNPRRFLSMTGYTVEEFDSLLPTFQTAFEQEMNTSTSGHGNTTSKSPNRDNVF